jgi:hypothetical protein
MAKTPQIHALPGMTPLGISDRKIIAVWSSKHAKYWLELIAHGSSFSYRSECGGGYLGHCTREDAFARMRAELDGYALDGITMVRR